LPFSRQELKIARWSITPLCGSKTPANVAAALAVEGDEGLQVDAPEVKELLKLMRGE